MYGGTSKEYSISIPGQTPLLPQGGHPGRAAHVSDKPELQPTQEEKLPDMDSVFR